MFEKEAEKKYCKGCKLRMEQCLWAWRNTNGLNEPNEKNCSCKEVPAYIAGFQDGYNKANEWHYVRDGDLPELGVSCRVGVKAVYLNSYENIVPIECWFDGKDFVYWEDRKPVGWTKVSDFKGKVYAWKYDDELPVPPKEVE